MAERVERPWPPVLDALTPDDVIAAGACDDGVYEWLDEHANGRAFLPVGAALRIAKRVDYGVEYIERAAGIVGYGNGNGYGYGYGDGDGDGDGYGNGNGNGYGYGDGDGYGYGDGYGDGDGGY